MERLTAKINNGYSTAGAGLRSVVPCVGKLGKLEDKEEEFGIDLIKLLNMKECDGLYYKDRDKILMGYFSSTNFETIDIGIASDVINSSCGYNALIFKLKDYGKTWAFTKEELEK